MLTTDQSPNFDSSTPEPWVAVKAGVVYMVVLSIVVLAACAWLKGPMGEHVARNWMVMIMMLTVPVPKLPIAWWQRLSMTTLLAPPIVLAQAYLAYGHNQYQSSAPISTAWLIASIAFYAAASWFAGVAARKLAWPGFRVFLDAQHQGR